MAGADFAGRILEQAVTMAVRKPQEGACEVSKSKQPQGFPDVPRRRNQLQIAPLGRKQIDLHVEWLFLLAP